MRARKRSEFRQFRRAYVSDDNIKPERSRRYTGHPHIFKAGQVVRETGIYEVLHERQHRSAHDALMYRDEEFPACDQCGNGVRFKIIRTAPYIFDDEDFCQ